LRWWDSDECISAGGLHTTSLHQPQLQPQHNLLLNPKQLLSNSCNTQTGIKPVAETGAEQFTSGDSAFSHITSTLVKSISIHLSKVRNCLIALMNPFLAPCHEPYRFSTFFFCLE